MILSFVVESARTSSKEAIPVESWSPTLLTRDAPNTLATPDGSLGDLEQGEAVLRPTQGRPNELPLEPQRSPCRDWKDQHTNRIAAPLNVRTLDRNP